MRTIIFDGHDDEDPVCMGEIFEIVEDSDRYIVQAIPEEGKGSCKGCMFFTHDCSAPTVTNSYKVLCAHINCVFKHISEEMEYI